MLALDYYFLFCLISLLLSLQYNTQLWITAMWISRAKNTSAFPPPGCWCNPIPTMRLHCSHKNMVSPDYFIFCRWFFLCLDQPLLSFIEWGKLFLSPSFISRTTMAKDINNDDGPVSPNSELYSLCNWMAKGGRERTVWRCKTTNRDEGVEL